MIRSALFGALAPLATAAAPPLVRGPVQLQAQPAVSHGALAAYPRVLPGPGVSAAAAAEINSALSREQSRAVAAARTCRADAKQARGGLSSDAWKRTVEVTMRGPAFLAVTATDSYDCGGPYPNDDMETSLVYDLATGAPVDWLNLLPRGATASVETSGDGARLGFVTWAELGRRYDDAASDDCSGLYSDGAPAVFQITLDAHAGALSATPGDINHAMHICATAVKVPAAALASLHVSPRLVEALRAARRLQP